MVENYASSSVYNQGYKSLTLPKLNNLTPSLISTTLKLMEESGELAEAIGKFNNMSGESNNLDSNEIVNRIANELLDVAQTAITMMFVLEEQHGVNIQERIDNHCKKLIQRGYIKV